MINIYKKHINKQELDSKHTKQLIKQYDKYNKLKKKHSELQEFWENKISNARNSEKEEFMNLSQSLEKKISKKSEEIVKVIYIYNMKLLNTIIYFY